MRFLCELNQSKRKLLGPSLDRLSQPHFRTHALKEQSNVTCALKFGKRRYMSFSKSLDFERTIEIGSRGYPHSRKIREILKQLQETYTQQDRTLSNGNRIHAATKNRPDIHILHVHVKTSCRMPRTTSSLVNFRPIKRRCQCIDYRVTVNSPDLCPFHKNALA